MSNDCSCGVKDRCQIKNISDCPCRTCIVNTMCSKVCYERHLYGARDLGFRPFTEEEFKNFPIKDLWLFQKPKENLDHSGLKNLLQAFKTPTLVI